MMAALAFPPVAIPQDISKELADASIETLMSMQVTSVSRRQEKIRNTSAAVYVITSDDIRRSGITDIADLLRMVPGMNVAQSNSSTWAISARGFNAPYSTKLLVTVDGRSVYDPTFSGVFWNLQNLVLQDIDRIEVIRGPGATMWGSNAVNGVISITTKKASATQGGLFVADAGMGKPGEGTFRFGQAIGKSAFYRVSARQTTRSNNPTRAGLNGGDAWNATNLESRLDWSPSNRDSYTFELGSYRGVAGSTQSLVTSVNPVTAGTVGLLSTSGINVLGRWTRVLSEDSNLKFQVYYDATRRAGWGSKTTNVLDFDLQHSIRFAGRHNVMWGIGFRDNFNHIDDTPVLGILPERQHTYKSGAFFQDEITAVTDKLIVTVGSKFERTSLTGSNVQPSVHLMWLPTSRQSIWAAASRAIRTTNIAERAVHWDLGTFDAGFTTGIVEVFGQPDTKSEELLAYETGYRYQFTRKFWVDLATFYNNYKNLSTTVSGAPYLATSSPPLLIAPQYMGNAAGGETYGEEVSANYRVNSLLTFRGGYSLLRMQIHADPGTSSAVEDAEGQNPRHQVNLSSSLNLTKYFEASSQAYFVSSLPAYHVPSYTRLDANITWKGLRHSELSLIGANLLGSHLEFGDTPAVSNVVKRSIFGRVAWRF